MVKKESLWKSSRWKVFVIVSIIAPATAILKHFLPGLSVEIMVAYFAFAGGYIGFKTLRRGGEIENKYKD